LAANFQGPHSDEASSGVKVAHDVGEEKNVAGYPIDEDSP
jgi:hypothetical protein